MVASRPSYRYQIAIVGLAVLMVATLLGSLSDFWRMDAPSSDLFLFALISAAVAWAVWFNPRVAVPGMIVGLALGLGLTLVKPEWSGYLRLVQEQAGEFWNHMRLLELETAFGVELGRVFLLASALGTGGLIVIEALGRGRSFWAITAGTVVLGTQWAWFFDKSGNYFTIYLVLSFLLWILANAGRREALWISEGRKINYQSQVMIPLACVVAIGVVSTLLPTQFQPIDIGALGDRVQEAFPVLKHLRSGFESGSGRFRLLSTGFSPNVGALGGPVKLDHAVALHLETSQQLSQTVYLRGIALPDYNGKTWLGGTKVFKPMGPTQSVESQYSPDVMTSAMAFTVIPALSLGDTIFATLEPVKVEGLKTGYKVDPDINLVADKAIAKGTRYQVSAKVAKYSSEQIRKLASNRTDQPEKTYLQVPGTLPPRVGDLARSITRTQPLLYDKAVALETTLRSMRYDLNVPSTPTGRDFVDYFLFDLKRGYCTYYASAMTVMLRELGIPARFVEGFAVAPSSPTTVSADGKMTYAVLNSQAHAWVEAYFAGYGWVTFDPTPRDDIPLIDRTTPLPNDSGSTTPADSGPSGSTTPDPLKPDRGLTDDPNLSDGSGGTATGSTAPLHKRPWVWAVGALVLLAGGGLILLRRLTAPEELKTTEANELVQEAWTRTSVVMDRFDFGRRPSQTPQEYAQTLSKVAPGLKETAHKVADDYTVARYGPDDRPLDPQAPIRAKGLWGSVQSMLLDRYGWRIYVLRRLRVKRRRTDFGD